MALDMFFTQLWIMIHGKGYLLLTNQKKRFFLEVNDSTLAPSDTDVQFLPVGIKNSLDS